MPSDDLNEIRRYIARCKDEFNCWCDFDLGRLCDRHRCEMQIVTAGLDPKNHRNWLPFLEGRDRFTFCVHGMFEACSRCEEAFHLRCGAEAQARVMEGGIAFPSF